MYSQQILARVTEHLASQAHAERAANSVKRLLLLPSEQRSRAGGHFAPPCMAGVCLGYYESSLIVDGRTVDVTPLRSLPMMDGQLYFYSPEVLELVSNNGETRFTVNGTFRAIHCSRFCLTSNGWLLPGRRCWDCQHVSAMLVKRFKQSSILSTDEGDSDKVRYDHRDYSSLLQTARSQQSRDH